MKVINMKTPAGIVSKLMIRSKCLTKIIALTDVICCNAQGNYTSVCLTDNTKWLSYLCLTKVNEMLADYGFIMVNKSCMVNAMHILSYTTGDRYTLNLTNNIIVNVSVRKKVILKQCLQ